MKAVCSSKKLRRHNRMQVRRRKEEGDGKHGMSPAKCKRDI